MKKILSILLLLISVTVLIYPYISSAQVTGPAPATPASSDYQLLAPITTAKGDGTGDTFPVSDDNALGQYINLMIKIVIGLCGVMAVMMFVIGGIEYMTSELVHSKESAKSRMTGAVVGLIIALGAYALLNTINPKLLDTNVALRKATVAVAINDSLPQIPVNGKYSNGIAAGTPLTGTPTPLPPNVTLHRPQCTTVGQPACTSTIGLNMSQVIAIQKGCNCPLILTGGTEWWLHGGQTGSTTHQNGNATVDLDDSPALDRYLSGGKPLVRMQRYPTDSGPYLYEGNHWHIGR